MLFLARTAMAFQFQAVAALSPVLTERFAIGLAEVGLLIGLYLAPGVLVAIPGSTIAARFGEKRIVVLSLFVMLAGNLLTLLAPSYEVMIFARVLSGAGGVVVNIVMTKLLVDWFAGREISTALAIFVNSWPVGIALALVILPFAAASGGLTAATLATTGIIVIGLIAFGVFYRPPEGLDTGPARVRVVALPYAPLVAAGLVWALYNAALAMVFSFGPAVLTERGWSVAEAGSLVSLYMFVLALALPLGGFLADKTGRRDLIIVLSLASFLVAMPFADVMPAGLLTIAFCVSAAAFAIGGGPIMSLPSAVLPPEARTFGMGVFFTLYYLVMMIAPRVGGGVADAAGDPVIAFRIGAVFCLGAIVCLLVFRRSAKPL